MTDWRTGELAEVRRDALSVLQDMLGWKLSTARWEGIASSVEALAAYLDLGDLAAAQEIVLQLELAGPVRTTRIGAVSPEPPPPPVRERVNQLIHRLAVAGNQAASAEPGGDEEGTQPGGAL